MQRLRKLLAAAERAGLTPPGVTVIVVSVMVWIAALLAGGRTAFLLVYGAWFMLGAAWVLGRAPVAVDAKRSTLSPRVRSGGVVEVEITLTARRRAGSVIVEELLPPQVAPPVRVPITSLPAGREVGHTYRFVPRNRGVYNIGPLTMTRTDPFGLTKHRSQLAPAVELIVHPATEPLQDRVATRQWEDPPIRPPVSKPWPIGFEFYGMRDYSFGDDPRRIVWRATARTASADGSVRLLVRESEQGITDRVSVLLDTDAGVHGSRHPSETLETAVRIAASAGVRHLRDGFAVSLETNGRRRFEALRSDRQRIRLLDELARVQAEPVPLQTMIKRLTTEHRRLSLHNLLITPHLDAASAAGLRILLQRSSLLIALILSPDSDPESLGRATSLGCGVVEVAPGMPFESAFATIVGAGRGSRAVATR